MGLFDSCRSNNIKISRRKFKLGRSIEFGGFLFDGSGEDLKVGPDPSRIEAIQSMQVPKLKRQVREFLGLVRTLRAWTPHISMSTNLMRGLSRKDVTFRWSPELDVEFKKVKEVVGGVNVLSPYVQGLPLYLYCDASREGGLGYVLVQPDGEKTNVLQCGSTTLSDTQKGYAIVELELLAIVWSLEKCDYFLRGAHDIKVFSDHAPLAGLERKDLSSVSNQRVVRMLEKTGVTVFPFITCEV